MHPRSVYPPAKMTIFRVLVDAALKLMWETVPVLHCPVVAPKITFLAPRLVASIFAQPGDGEPRPATPG